MSDKAYREKALERRAGLSEDAKKVLAEVNAASVWSARCPVCGQALEGTPAELMKHKHG